MKPWPCLLLALCLLPALAVAGEPVAAAFDGGRVLRRVVVPSVEQPQGEVQLVSRGNELVVCTLLASKILKRVLAVIDGKEARAWPESRAGYAASRRYRDELFRAGDVAWESFRQRQDQAETRQFLAIEFILGANGASVSLAIPALAGGYGELTLSGQSPVKSWRAPEDYVRANMIEIVKDSFGVDDATAAGWLEPLRQQQ